MLFFLFNHYFCYRSIEYTATDFQRMQKYRDMFSFYAANYISFAKFFYSKLVLIRCMRIGQLMVSYQLTNVQSKFCRLMHAHYEAQGMFFVREKEVALLLYASLSKSRKHFTVDTDWNFYVGRSRSSSFSAQWGTSLRPPLIAAIADSRDIGRVSERGS